MSTTIAGQSTQPPAQAELSLTSVVVAFLKKRPKGKIKLAFELDGKTPEVEIDEGSSVRWAGEIRSLASTRIVIQAYRRHRVMRWDKSWQKFASVEVLLAEHAAPVIDIDKQIQVTLKVTASHVGDEHPVGSSTSQAPPIVSDVESTSDGPQIPDVVAAVAAAKETVDNKIVISEKFGKIWSVIEFLDDIGEPLKEIHPAVSTALTVFKALTELCKKQKACRDAASDLADQFESFLEIKGHVEPLKKREETRRAVQYMLESISGASNYICEKTTTGFRGVLSDIFGSEYKEKIADFQKEFVRAKDAFDRSVALTTFVTVDGIALTTRLLFLHDKLSECDNAHFTSDGGCLKDTRMNLRQSVETWLDSADEASTNVFWLYGKAGSGKTAIANTVAKIVQDERKYKLTCFFCKRDDPGLSSPRRLLPTLAYSFAHHHESYRAAITVLLQSPDGTGIAATADVKTQFEKLFKELLVQTVDPLRLHVVLVDALDESGTPEDQKKLAIHILALSRAAPWIKVFVTSRDEPEIHDIFSQASDCTPRNINEEMGTDNDIRLYINSEAADLHIPLNREIVQQLVDQAAGLFIWCRTLFEHLRKCLSATRTTVLTQLLSGTGQHDSSIRWSQLYKLYDKIVDTILESPEPAARAFTIAILSIVSVVVDNQPLSAKAATTFLHRYKLHLEFPAEVADEIVGKLHAVLYVDSAANGVIRAHHISFYEFLKWKASTSAESGWETSDSTHRLMVHSCLRTLHEELKFNICKVEVPVLNKNIADLAERISAHMSETLQYSCRYWFIHLCPSTLTAADIEKDVLELLCSKMLLFWFESLSLLGSMRQIQFLFRTCMGKFFQLHLAIIAATEDACRFVSSFADAMDSISHIYLSALLWLPENSVAYTNFRLSARTNWHLIRNKRKNWDALVWRSDRIDARSVAFSPVGRFVACGTEGGDVYIFDSQTGTLEGEALRGHQEAVCGLAYSPDGRFLASVSDDGTARIWDLKAGGTISALLEGHSEWVRCVAFSPDGLFVASASYDRTVRIWNARTGKSEGEPLQHSDWVRAVAYSPDGRLIASACNDHVRIWDVSSRREAVEPLQGHQSHVLSVAYSPDGRTIVSGSDDKTIRIWDARTGQAIGERLQGHTNGVSFVVYCPQGRYILSGSWDGTVRLWDAASRVSIGEPLRASRVASVSYSPSSSLIACASKDRVRVWVSSTCFTSGSQSQDLATIGDTRSVYAVAYSPDGRFIASCSDSDHIQVWDAHTGALVDQPVLRHAEMRQGATRLSIEYSRDGKFIVSGSADQDNSSVCILDVRTGATVSGPLRGHSGSISSVAYSPDGRVVASASWDSTVRLWDVQTGTAIGEPLQVGSAALSVAFSPDGRLLACKTYNGCIYIWDARTRTSLRDPIQGHANLVCSVAFSPDGRHIASGSYDRSVRIWDAQTGQASGSPLRGHRLIVLCVACSPDGRFIASYSDRKVIIWNAQSRSAYKTLRGPSAYIRSVTYSPDGRFLASGAENGKIYVHDVSNEHDETEARWISCCSHMDMQDGWVKDGDALLLWVPVPYREDFRTCARLIIPNQASTIGAYKVNYRTLLQYSGRNWTDIFSGFDD